MSLKIYDLRAVVRSRQHKQRCIGDAEVRQALNLIIDREDLREAIFGVKKSDKDSPCEFISGPFIPASPYYNQTVPNPSSADLAKADALACPCRTNQVVAVGITMSNPLCSESEMNATLDKEAADLIMQIAIGFQGLV